MNQLKKQEDAKDYEQRKNEILNKQKGPTSVLDKKNQEHRFQLSEAIIVAVVSLIIGAFVGKHL